MAFNLQKAEEYWIQAARAPGWEGALAFAYFVFGFKPEPFHVDWIQKFFSTEHPKQVIVAPRGSAKTTYVCIALLKYISDNPWDANALLSVASSQAKERLAFIRGALDSERYQKIYPWIQLDPTRPDTQLQFTIWDSRYTYQRWRSDITRLGGDFKSPTLVVGGTGGRGITGSRVTGVLTFDDTSDQDNARTKDLREQLWRWITDVVLPILSGDHYRIWSISTRWADGDTASQQIATGEYEYTEIRAITRIGDKLRSYWPKQFPFKTLLSILNERGKTSFMLSYLNSIIGLSGAIFTADMLRTDFPRDDRGRPSFPEFEKIIVSMDAAIKIREANDESTIAIVGIRTSPHTSLPQLWVLRLRVDRWKNMEVLENLEAMWAIALHNYKADEYSVLIETVAGQQLFLTLMEQKPDFSIPPSLIDTYSPISDKVTRAQPIAAAGERGDLIVDLQASWYPKWFSQYIEFTGKDGNDDDLVDVISQVGIREFGDLNSYQSFNPSVTMAHIEGLSV